MNSTNSSLNTKPFSRNTGRFIIKKNTPPIETKKILSGPPQTTLKNFIKSKPDNPFQLSQTNPSLIQQKGVEPSEKTQPTLLRKETEPKKNFGKAEIDLEGLVLKPEVNLDNYILKSQYEDLRKKFEALTRKHDELKLKNRNLEREVQHEKRKKAEVTEENEKLKERVEELEAENQELLDDRQKSESSSRPILIEEEAKMDDNEMRSLRLAMRFEAENLLMSRISQLAALQMLYDRPDPSNANNNDNPDNINPDNMTYEELLQLEERMGKVSKGLTIEQIKQIPKTTYHKTHEHTEETCTICFNEVESGAKMRKLPCSHEYHSKCIKQWLLNEKTCPICKKEVATSN